MDGWTRWTVKKPQPLRIVWGWSKENGLMLGFNRFGVCAQIATGKTAEIEYWQLIMKPVPPRK